MNVEEPDGEVRRHVPGFRRRAAGVRRNEALRHQHGFLQPLFQRMQPAAIGSPENGPARSRRYPMKDFIHPLLDARDRPQEIA